MSIFFIRSIETRENKVVDFKPHIDVDSNADTAIPS
jgi:hypothetical protein